MLPLVCSTVITTYTGLAHSWVLSSPWFSTKSSSLSNTKQLTRDKIWTQRRRKNTNRKPTSTLTRPTLLDWNEKIAHKTSKEDQTEVPNVLLTQGIFQMIQGWVLPEILLVQSRRGSTVMVLRLKEARCVITAHRTIFPDEGVMRNNRKKVGVTFIGPF